jgi:Ca2+-binding EF-hand superfamily protein
MEEFKALDRNHDSLLTREELYGCLDTKLGRTFDREIGEQLWAKACDGGRDTVAVERIVDVVI